MRVLSLSTDDDVVDCSSPVTLRSDALSQFDSVDDALEVCHVKQRLAVHKAWRATIRTTRSKHGVAHSSNAESKPCLESLVRNLYMSSSLERALDTKHCKPDNAFALVYIAQLDVLHVVESHGWDVLGQIIVKARIRHARLDPGVRSNREYTIRASSSRAQCCSHWLRNTDTFVTVLSCVFFSA